MPFIKRHRAGEYMPKLVHPESPMKGPHLSVRIW